MLTDRVSPSLLWTDHLSTQRNHSPKVMKPRGPSASGVDTGLSQSAIKGRPRAVGFPSHSTGGAERRLGRLLSTGSWRGRARTHLTG